MKKTFLNSTINLIQKYYPEYDETKLNELKYGLEGFYLTITKMFVIIPLAIFLNLQFYLIILLILFNILRSTGFGLHATKSWICLLSSSIIFLGIPFISKILVLPFFIKILLGITGILLIYIYAPADTKKRPIINKNKRKKFKYITTLSSTIIIIFSFFINSEIISNLSIFSVLLEAIMVNPYTYKIFNLNYDNYKNYVLQNDIKDSA